MNKYRVVHVGTGPTGVEGLRTLINHPDLELVGHYVDTEAKIGVDSGVLAGTDPVGVTAVKDWDALLALEPHCVNYMGDGVARLPDAVDDIDRILRLGINVATTSLLSFVYPPLAPEALRAQLADACAAGGTSMFNTGINPGFGTTGMALQALSLAGEVTRVHTRELSVYADYPVEFIMQEVWGFGKPLDYARPLFCGIFSGWWGGTVHTIADVLGVKLDEVVERYEVAAFKEDVDTAFGPVPEGTTAAVWPQLHGMVNGKAFLTHDHVNVVDWDQVPSDWPAPLRNDAGGACPHQLQVMVEGDPPFSVVLNMPSLTIGVQVTANHCVNAIPAVCEARSGLLGPLDMPAYTARHVVTG